MKKKITCIAVILHYIGLEDTIECVESFLANCHDTDIVIVDNASPNNTGTVLLEKYNNNPRVNIVLNEVNLGFSGGNNVGISYALNHYEFDFLILANNDTVILDDRFVQLVKETYTETKYAVLGPMILTADGRCDSNPLYYLPYTREKALNDINYHSRRISAIKHPVYGLAYGSYKKIKRRLGFDNSTRYNRKKAEGIEIITPHENVVLHGSFLVFSQEYFKLFSGLDARTFLYAEEDILFQHCIHNSLKLYYNPQIVVFHKEGRSVKNQLENQKEKDLFFSEYAIKAINAYLELLDELERPS